MSLKMSNKYMYINFKRNLIEIAKTQIISADQMNVDNWVFQAYVRTFDSLPCVLHAGTYDDTYQEIPELHHYLADINEIVKQNLNSKDCDILKTTENLLTQYPDSKEINSFLPLKTIIYNDNFIAIPYYRMVLFHQDAIDLEVFKCFVAIEKKNSEAKVYYVSKGNYGFDTYPFKLNVKSIEGNYNDDLPLEKINNILQEDGSGIMLFNGVPGGGKTSFIRYIIDQNKKNKEFLYLDANVFYSITDSSFISFLLRYKNAIIILEDCEKILKSREGKNQNELISTILNISDGLLGDSLNLKFICTFNTDLENIDKAIMRKGRLKLKYEFKPLCKEKVAKIFEKKGIDPKLAKEMTLAEIYNFEEDNGNKEQRKTIGFGV